MWEEEYQAAVADTGGDLSYAKFSENHRFQIPDDAHWKDVRQTPKNVGAAIQRRGKRYSLACAYEYLDEKCWRHANKVQWLAIHPEVYRLYNSYSTPEKGGLSGACVEPWQSGVKALALYSVGEAWFPIALRVGLCFALWIGLQALSAIPQALMSAVEPGRKAACKAERKHGIEILELTPQAVTDLGLAAIVLVGVLSLATIFTMIARIAGVNALPAAHPEHGGRTRWVRAFWDAVVVQSIGQTRYREDCKPSKPARAWYLSRWFVHAAVMWGFMGLLLATALDYLLDVVGVKAAGTFVPLWYPVRLIGTLSGLLFMYGVSVLLYWRWRAGDKAHSLSLPSDWIFLVLLWVSGMTGFIIEIALYLPGAPRWGYWMFILHVAVSMTLLLLLPLSKFAHAPYRMVALYIHALKPLPEDETTPVLSH